MAAVLRMQPVSRRSFVQGAIAVAPAATLTLPGRTDGLELDPALRGKTGCASGDEVARLLKHDMSGKHAGRMHGVPPTYNWAKHPRVGVGNHPDRHWFHAVSGWGQIYEDMHGSPGRNVRVACRDICLWILSRRTGTWRRANASKGVNGLNYVEDYAGNANKPAPLRQEPHGAVSATLGGGYNFHFYSTRGRAPIAPADIGGVVSMYSARVIMDDPNGVDERHLARYLASAGADYWLDRYVGAGPGTVADVGIGKARYLSSNWLTLTMSTLPLPELYRNPPPGLPARPRLTARPSCPPPPARPFPASSRRRGPATRRRGR
jgi:hypothetical protein